MGPIDLAYVVDRNIDGDTIGGSVVIPGPYGLETRFARRLRLLTVNAPEIGTDDGKAVADYVASLVKPGDTVRLIAAHDRMDQYDRVLGDVELSDGRSLTQLLTEGGYVKPQTKAKLAKLAGVEPQEAQQMLDDHQAELESRASRTS